MKGIQYEKLGTWYKMEQFTDFSSWEEYLIPAEHSLFEQVAFDSGIEKAFAEELNHRDDIRMFVKLPGWFTVPTPVGEYNPDWAIVKDDEDGKPVLCLVRETKGTHDPNKRHPDENRKILCGEKHFKDALGVDYKVAVKASEI